MRKSGSPSWRFMEDDAQFLHLALFVRDAAGLTVARSDDIPPRLAGELPYHGEALTGAGRGAAAGQWVTWWYRLLAQAVREALRGNAPDGDQDPLARVRAVYAGREEVFDPPGFGSLADLPQLQQVAAAMFAHADRCGTPGSGPCHRKAARLPGGWCGMPPRMPGPSWASRSAT